MIQDSELNNILDKLAASLKSVYGTKLKAVILYGSVARGTATPDSDIDIMVLVDSSPEELKKYADYAMFLPILHWNILRCFLL